MKTNTSGRGCKEDPCASVAQAQRQSWLYSDIESDPSTISAPPPGIGPWPRSVNLTSRPRDGGFSRRERRDRENTRRDRRACYFDVTQRYRTRRDRRCIFWQPITFKPSIDVPNACFIVSLTPRARVDRARKRGNSTPRLFGRFSLGSSDRRLP